MTLVPLIFAIVASSAGSAARSGQGGRLLTITSGSFLALSLCGIALGALVCYTTLWFWPLPSGTLDGLPGAGPVPEIPGTVDQLLAIIPTNPIAAAAAGQLFPLAIFALLFGLAMSRGGEGGHRTLVSLVEELAATMMRLVEWVLMFAPLGVFVLALGLARSAGFGLASLLGHMVVVEIASALLGIGFCYALVAVTRAYPLLPFMRGIAGAQAMAAGTTSSLACTPAMLDAALVRLRLPPDVAGLVIPLAVSVFRFASMATLAGGC
jgi:Na+/H+-dicarboxylate symporter